VVRQQGTPAVSPVDRLPPFFVASVGMVLLTIMDATVKSLSASYSTAQIVFIRYLLMGLILATIVVFTRQGWPSAHRLRIHFGRAVLMLITGSTFFYALGHLPLAEVFVLALTSPIFIALFASLFLKEPVKPAVAFAIAAGFAGVLVMVLGDSARSGGSYEPLALASALLSPVTYALGIVLLRAQTAREPVTVILATHALMVAALVLPIVAVVPVTPAANDLAAFAAVGLLGSVGHLAFGNGLKRMPAARFAMIEYTGVIWAALLGYAFFNETPRATAWIGAALIVAGCLIVVTKRAAPPPPAADATSDDAAASQDQRA
jgi:S-adenosylmethionine uptake transporter